jgi:transcriptional regulatory protein LevR
MNNSKEEALMMGLNAGMDICPVHRAEYSVSLEDWQKEKERLADKVGAHTESGIADKIIDAINLSDLLSINLGAAVIRQLSERNKTKKELQS